MRYRAGRVLGNVLRQVKDIAAVAQAGARFGLRPAFPTLTRGGPLLQDDGGKIEHLFVSEGGLQPLTLTPPDPTGWTS